MRFAASADFAQPHAEIRRLAAELGALEKQIAAASVRPGANGLMDPRAYQRAAAQAAAVSRDFRSVAAATGAYEVAQTRVNSATQEYTRLMQQQKLGFRSMIRNWGTMNATYKEQLRLRKMIVTSMTTDAAGNTMADTLVPKQVDARLASLGSKIGFVSEALKSGSTQMINWGKNMQWAGRQLMVGFTLPLVAVGAAAGVMRYKVDQELTRVKKVYDVAAHDQMTASQQMIAADQERATVAAKSTAIATQAAKTYGTAMTDTLDAEAQLAATGLRGSDLFAQTSEAMRVATLGEMDYNKAVTASIALQSTFKLSASETAAAFDYMNAVENATSLSLDDFATAIPIAAAPVRAMGGDVKDLGVLLTAMKERGIAAAQGANALKSAMQRLFRPSAQIQQEFTKITGANITDITSRNQGNILGLLKELSDVTDKLSRNDKIKVFAGLFGTYQVTRMTALIDGMKDLENGTGQVSKAFELAGESVSDLRARSDSEIAQIQQSASGRFKIAVETLKAEFAGFGEAFLNIATKALGGLMTLFDKIGALPGWVKTTGVFLAFFAAISGPIIMVTGLFVNWTGQIVKASGAILGLVSRWRLVSKEQQTANVVAETSAKAFDLAAKGAYKEAAAVADLTNWLEAYNKTKMQAAGTPVAGASGAMGMAMAGGYRPTSGTSPTGGGIIMPGTAQETKKMSANMRMASISGGLFAASMAATLISSNGVVDNIAQWLIIFSLMLPLVQGIATAMNSAKISAGITAIATKASAVATSVTAWGTGIAAAARASGPLSSKIAGVAGALFSTGPIVAGIAIALAAAGFAAYKMWQNSKEAAASIRQIYTDSEGLGKILGYTPSETPVVQQADGTAIVPETEKLRQFNEQYGDVVSAIENASTAQEKLNYALAQGVKVISTGGTAAQAKEAVELALKAAGESIDDMKGDPSLILPIQAQLNFDTDSAIIQNQLTVAQQALENSMSSFDDKGVWESIFNKASTPSGASIQAAETAGDTVGQALTQAMTNGVDTTQVFGQLNKMLNIFDQQLAQQTGEDPGNTHTQQILHDRETFVRGFLTRMGKSDEDIQVFIDAMNSGTDAMQLFLQTGADLPAGMKPPTTFMNFMDVLIGRINEAIPAFDKAKTHASAYLEQLQKFQGAQAYLNGLLPQDWVDFSQGIMGSVQEDVTGMMSARFDNQMQAAIDAATAAGQSRMDAFDAQVQARMDKYDRESNQMQNEHEREMRQFDNEWEHRTNTVTNSYDRRIDRVNAAIEAEQNADQIRQAIFDKEMTRLQRLADAQNKNIDLNVALNQGNMDEAARIQNDMAAAGDQAAMEDENTRASEASQRRQDRLGNIVKKIEKAKDARLKALQKIEDAQRRSLERQQKREEKALEREKQRYSDWADERKQQIQDEVDQQIAAVNKIWDHRKQLFDDMIKEITSYIPTSEKDMQQHIKEVMSKYDTWGLELTGKGEKWAKAISDSLTRNTRIAMADMRTKINWEGAGEGIAKQIVRGMGVSWGDFTRMLAGLGINWVNRGNTSKGEKHANQEGPQPVNQHRGGIIGQGSGSRVGRSGGTTPGEVWMRALPGEAVINKNATRRNRALIDQMNGSTQRSMIDLAMGKRRDEGAGPDPGIAGIFGSAITAATASMMRKAIGNVINTTRAGTSGFIPTVPGFDTATKAGKHAIEWALNNGNPSDSPYGTWYRYCLSFVRQAFGAGSLYGNAAEAWAGAKYKHHDSPGHTPPGVPIWFDTGASGHVAINLGKGKVISTDIARPGYADVGMFSTLQGWGPYLGWSEDINGKHAIHMPQAKLGGKMRWDAPIMAHADERVLTEVQNQNLEEGLRKFANNGGNSYTLNVYPSADMDEIKFAKAVGKVIKDSERKKPSSRTIKVGA